MNKLTKREHQIIEMACQDYTNKAIGIELGISIRTVQCLRDRAYKKLGVHSPIQMVRAWAKLTESAQSSEPCL